MSIGWYGFYPEPDRGQRPPYEMKRILQSEHQNFDSLGLHPSIIQAINEHGYSKPTLIQAQAIPAVLQGLDVMGAAQTGTGKTAGFTLPMLHKLASGRNASSNQARALVLTPTRELAAQVGESIRIYGKHLNLRSAVVYGGVKINPQMMKLRKGVDILVATPGRLLDLHHQNAVRFRNLEVLVLDEADRMLDMGFLPDIQSILALLPRKKQTLMFSATFSRDIRKLARGLVQNPVEISVTPRNSTVKSVKQWINPVDKKRKSALLAHLISTNNWHQVLVFTRTKQGADRLQVELEKKGMEVATIHGDKSQGARTRALAEFKQGKTKILIATDIAARGLDISQLPQVVNFDLPNVAQDYVHRIGRTGRAGARGEAISLVSADEAKQLADIEQLINKTLPRQFIDNFEPVHDLPVTSLKVPAAGDKTPKKKKKRARLGQSTKSAGNVRNGVAQSLRQADKSRKKSAAKKRYRKGHKAGG